jgi:hypothetical protein
LDLSSAAAATDSCTAGKISVLGTHKLHLHVADSVGNWILGRKTGAEEGLFGNIAGIKVTVRQGGTTTTGTFTIIFGYMVGDKIVNEGALTIGSSCAIDPFYAHK